MRLLAIFILTCFLSVNAYAKVWITYNSKTKEVIDLSKRDDVVLNNPDWKKDTLTGEPIDYNSQIQYHPSYYFYKDGKFVLNIKKISDEALAEEKAQEKAEEMKLIEKQMKLEALKELKAKGKKFNQISEKDFE